METIGDVLAEARREQSLSIRDASEATRIRGRYLEAIEANKFAVLPGEAYGRAFIKDYCSFLGIDSGPLVHQFNEEVGVSSPMGGDLTREVVNRPSGRFKRTADRERTLPVVPIVVVVVLALVVGLFYGLSGDPDEESRTRVVGAGESVGSSTDGSVAGSPGAPADIAKVTVVGEAVGRDGAWVRVLSDDNVIFEGVMSSGEEQTWRAEKTILLRVGNAAALSVSINGSDAEVLGDEGLVLENEYDSDS